ncbi:MAG: YbaK/EbsC family protein [Rhodobacteraceae bacterium]|nr:YbaK/EbsC family protein [Paracoccaceae bacterium]
MSKSVRRVRAALEAAGLPTDIRQTEESARTAALAAQALGCEVDQIAKSILFRGAESGTLYLFVTAGGRQVHPESASALAQEALGKADAAEVRARTGFAIGGVAPVGHLEQPRAFFDRHLMAFGTVWAAAGTPAHVFPAEPAALARAAGAVVADFST